MIAAVIRDDGKVAVAELPVPRPAPGEALIRVNAAGICSTDIELARGYLGFRGIPGHEFVGTVVEAPPPGGPGEGEGAPRDREASAAAARSAPRVEGAGDDLVGARVVGEINAGCGNCAWCVDGMERHCRRRTVLGIAGRPGAFAEYVTLPVKNLHRVPAKLSNERALFAEPLAAAFQILTQVEVSPHQQVCVMGDGKLGGLIARVLKFAGAHVTVLGRHEKKLAPLREEGCECVLEAPGEKALDWKFSLVIEATGRPDAILRACELTQARGKIVLKTTCAETKPLNLAPIVVDEITVIGSRCGRFPPALNALATGAIKPDLGIEARFPLEKATEAFAAASAPGAGKVIFEVAA